MTPLTYTVVEDAAQVLGGPFTVDWLKGHLTELPHVRLGTGRGRAGRIGFTEAHLVAIVDRFTVRPAQAPAEPQFTPSRRESRRAHRRTAS